MINLDRNSIAGLIALFLTLLSSTGAAVADVVTPEVPMGRGAQCVEPIEIMRRDHFEFIKHQRDQTVYHGIRGTRIVWPDVLTAMRQKALTENSYRLMPRDSSVKLVIPMPR